MTKAHPIDKKPENGTPELPREMLRAMHRAELMELGVIPDDTSEDPMEVPQGVLDYLEILPSEVGQQA